MQGETRGEETGRSTVWPDADEASERVLWLAQSLTSLTHRGRQLRLRVAGRDGFVRRRQSLSISISISSAVQCASGQERTKRKVNVNTNMSTKTNGYNYGEREAGPGRVARRLT